MADSILVSSWLLWILNLGHFTEQNPQNPIVLAEFDFSQMGKLASCSFGKTWTNMDIEWDPINIHQGSQPGDLLCDPEILSVILVYNQCQWLFESKFWVFLANVEFFLASCKIFLANVEFCNTALNGGGAFRVCNTVTEM